jgi:cytochrome b pre-mRNA-processing protein 3
MRGLFRRDRFEEAAESLYRQIVAQARRPGFFRDGGLPDTLDGRFDLLVLHVFLVMHRLKRDQAQTAGLSQALFDVLFRDMDQSLRELGAGDVGIGRRVRRMAEAFYGRVAAYEQGLTASGEGLASEGLASGGLAGGGLEGAVERNLFGHGPAEPAQVAAQVAALAGYIRREAAALARQEAAALLRGEVVFGAAPDLRSSRSRDFIRAVDSR